MTLESNESPGPFGSSDSLELSDSLEFLLNHPKTGQVTSDVNAETIERRAFSPKKIKIFSSKYTNIESCPEYTFSTDTEAKKLLPDIIDNPVQSVVPG
jgi:pyrophosphate--fructose-6-phosphate 1-phosphotransferase